MDEAERAERDKIVNELADMISLATDDVLRADIRRVSILASLPTKTSPEVSICHVLLAMLVHALSLREQQEDYKVNP